MPIQKKKMADRRPCRHPIKSTRGGASVTIQGASLDRLVATKQSQTLSDYPTVPPTCGDDEVISRDHREDEFGHVKAEAMILIAKWARAERQPGWESLYRIASLKVCEEPVERQRGLMLRLWGVG